MSKYLYLTNYSSSTCSPSSIYTSYGNLGGNDAEKMRWYIDKMYNQCDTVTYFNEIPTQFPPISLSNTLTSFKLKWNDASIPPAENNNITWLRDAGYISYSYTGAPPSASYVGGYWDFGTCSSGQIYYINNFRLLTRLAISGNGASLTYSGPLSNNLVYVLLSSTGIQWTHSGMIPKETNYINISGSEIKLYYSGEIFGTNLTRLTGNNIYWSYTGSLDSAYININGNNINWTGLNLGTRNITYLALTKYRQSKLTISELIQFLQHLGTRTGTLPATATLNEYNNGSYAGQPTIITISGSTANPSGSSAEQAKYWWQYIASSKSCILTIGS